MGDGEDLGGFEKKRFMKQSKKIEDTHLFIDNGTLFMSSDISPVFNFLVEIDKEIKSILNFQTKLDQIREQHLNTLDLVSYLAKKLKDANIDFKYDIKEKPATFADKLEFDLPLRSQMIVLFSYLEVLYFLDLAYIHETIDENGIKKIAMDDKNVKKFLNKFILAKNNEYYNDNSRLRKLNSQTLRNLRNSLIHFFSLSSEGLSVMPSFLDKKARKLEKVFKESKNGNVFFISPDDLYEMIRSGYILRLNNWSEDFQKNNNIFKKKIKSVISLVYKYGAVTVFNKNLNV